MAPRRKYRDDKPLDVFAALATDLKARDAKGWDEHGVALDARFDKDWLQEAYEEALDMVVYLKAALMRRDMVRREVWRDSGFQV